jgi:hypothetical protein
MWEENIFYGERKKNARSRLFSFTLCIPASILVALWASALFILVDKKRKVLSLLERLKLPSSECSYNDRQ